MTAWCGGDDASGRGSIETIYLLADCSDRVMSASLPKKHKRRDTETKRTKMVFSSVGYKDRFGDMIGNYKCRPSDFPRKCLSYEEDQSLLTRYSVNICNEWTPRT